MLVNDCKLTAVLTFIAVGILIVQNINEISLFYELKNEDFPPVVVGS